MPNLKYLDLDNNRLSTLPSEIKNLKNLIVLNLNNNQISTFPSEIGKLVNLINLKLSDNQLSTLPSEIANLENLQSLHLRNNQISELPSEIGNLQKLSFLNLADNQLSTFPSEIGNLTTLLDLNSINNQILELPPELGNLKSLEFLSLDNKQFSLKSILTVVELVESVKHMSIYFDGRERELYRKIKQDGQEGEYRSIAIAFAEAHPDISIENFETFFLRLSTDQVRGIIEYKLPFRELGIGFDTNGNVSTELDVDTPVFELLDKIDRIKKTASISNEEAHNLVKTKPDFFLRIIYDFGITPTQAEQINPKEIITSIYEMLTTKILKENYEADDNEGLNLGELTEEDKLLARSSFDEIIAEYKKSKHLLIRA